MNPPKELCGIEWPEMNVLFLSLNRSILGPNMIAPEIIQNDLVVYQQKLNSYFLILTNQSNDATTQMNHPSSSKISKSIFVQPTFCCPTPMCSNRICYTCYHGANYNITVEMATFCNGSGYYSGTCCSKGTLYKCNMIQYYFLLLHL